MKSLIVRWAATALIALPLFTVGLPVQPVLADDPVEFICFDIIDEDGKPQTLCERAEDIAYECERTGNTGPECTAAGAGTSEVRETLRGGAAGGFSAGNNDSGHGNDGGGLVRSSRTSALKG